MTHDYETTFKFILTFKRITIENIYVENKIRQFNMSMGLNNYSDSNQYKIKNKNTAKGLPAHMQVRFYSCRALCGHYLSITDKTLET